MLTSFLSSKGFLVRLLLVSDTAVVGHLRSKLDRVGGAENVETVVHNVRAGASVGGVELNLDGLFEVHGELEVLLQPHGGRCWHGISERVGILNHVCHILEDAKTPEVVGVLERVDCSRGYAGVAQELRPGHETCVSLHILDKQQPDLRRRLASIDRNLPIGHNRSSNLDFVHKNAPANPLVQGCTNGGRTQVRWCCHGCRSQIDSRRGVQIGACRPGGCCGNKRLKLKLGVHVLHLTCRRCTPGAGGGAITLSVFASARLNRLTFARLLIAWVRTRGCPLHFWLGKF